MFWRKKLKLPISIEDAKVIEEYMLWINDNIFDILEKETILPTPSFFERVLTSSEDDAFYILQKVGEFYSIDISSIQLSFYQEGESDLTNNIILNKEKGTAGLYFQEKGKYNIAINKKQLKDPQSLVAVMAHEVAHYILIGMMKEYESSEELTDLLAIAGGFGIFLGNSAFNFSQYQTGDGWGGWSYSSQGYLSQQEIGYAMAFIEEQRTEKLPSWNKYFNNNVKSDFKHSFNYIRQTKTS